MIHTSMKHLVLVGQYNGNYYIQDVAPLDENLEGIVMNHILEMLIKLLKVGMEAIDRKGLIAI